MPGAAAGGGMHTQRHLQLRAPASHAVRVPLPGGARRCGAAGAFTYRFTLASFSKQARIIRLLPSTAGGGLQATAVGTFRCTEHLGPPMHGFALHCTTSLGSKQGLFRRVLQLAGL